MNLEQIQSLSQKIERILESSRVLKAENYRLNEKNTNLQQKLSEIQIQVDNTNELLKRKEEERVCIARSSSFSYSVYCLKILCLGFQSAVIKNTPRIPQDMTSPNPTVNMK